jgi:hypothetical protein
MLPNCICAPHLFCQRGDSDCNRPNQIRAFILQLMSDLNSESVLEKSHPDARRP